MTSGRIFVTGGSGELGRRVLSRVVADGYTVLALARSHAAAQCIAAAGATACRGDLFDPSGYGQALDGARAVLHLATHTPPPAAARRISAWSENDRIRSEGTALLLRAALNRRVRTFIYPSVVSVYPDSAERWIDAEREAPADPPPPVLRSTLAAEGEVARFSAAGGRGIVLRLGACYGPEAGSRRRLTLARYGLFLVPGAAQSYHSSLWLDDAASAVVAALQPAVGAGIYDVVDDRPLTHHELRRALASSVGRKRLWSPPDVLLRLAAGSVYDLIAASRRVSNRRFKRVSGWRPAVSDAVQGWPLLAARSG